MINHLIKGIRLDEHDQVLQFDVDHKVLDQQQEKLANIVFAILIIFILILIFYDFI